MYGIEKKYSKIKIYIFEKKKINYTTDKNSRHNEITDALFINWVTPWKFGLRNLMTLKS